MDVLPDKIDRVGNEKRKQRGGEGEKEIEGGRGGHMNVHGQAWLLTTDTHEKTIIYSYSYRSEYSSYLNECLQFECMTCHKAHRFPE